MSKVIKLIFKHNDGSKHSSVKRNVVTKLIFPDRFESLFLQLKNKQITISFDTFTGPKGVRMKAKVSPSFYEKITYLGERNGKQMFSCRNVNDPQSTIFYGKISYR